jgi:hypothetical protein
MSAEVPYSFYNISDSLENNVFKFSQEGDTYTITIPNGSYDIDELVDAFNSNTDFSARLTMSFDEITLKIKFTAVADDLLLLFHQSNVNRELGFPVLYGDEEGPRYTLSLLSQILDRVMSSLRVRVTALRYRKLVWTPTQQASSTWILETSDNEPLAQHPLLTI